LKKKFDQNISARKYLIGAKHCVWDQIKNIMQQIRGNLNVLQDTENLERSVKLQVTKAWEQLGDKVQIANDVIKFLNNKSKEI
jgi:hypothetical protein